MLYRCNTTYVEISNLRLHSFLSMIKQVLKLAGAQKLVYNNKKLQEVI